MEIAVEGVPTGVKRLLLERYRIDANHSNAFTVWKQMGSPASPTDEQYAQLKAAGQLQTVSSPEWLDVHNGHISLSSELPRQALELIRFSW